MIGLLVFLFGVFVTLGMCGLAAKSDYKGYKIPNIISIVIIGAFAVTFGILTLTEQRDVFFKPIGMHLGAAFLVFMLTSALYAFKKLGAGDSKFATAIALWVGLVGLVPFLFYMSLAGGVIAAISLYLQKRSLFNLRPKVGGLIACKKVAGMFLMELPSLSGLWFRLFIWGFSVFLNGNLSSEKSL